MAEASLRVARRRVGMDVEPDRAWFLAAGVERLPEALDSLGDRVTVRFPWGSLLRGALGLDAAVTDSIARLVAPGGRLELTLSVVGRDAPIKTGLAAGPGEAARTSMVTAFADHGLELDEIRELTADDLATLHSAWARRLRAGGDRPAWRVAFTRPLRAVG